MMRYLNKTWLFLKEKKKNIADILLIFFLLVGGAIVPLQRDSQVYKSQVSLGWGELNTHVSLKFLNFWLREGAIKNKFVLCNEYPSIELENNDKTLYVTYPPGYLVPLLIIEKVRGVKEASVYTIKSFIKAEYYLSIFFLGLFFYCCLHFIELKSRTLKIVIPVIVSCLWAFLPYNFFYMRNVFFADQAIILLTIIFLLIEILLYFVKQKPIRILLNILSCLLVLWGILTDYYFYFVVFTAFVFRIINAFEAYPRKGVLYKLFSDTWALILSTLAGMLLYVVWLISISNQWSYLAEKFYERSGFSGSNEEGFGMLLSYFCEGFTCLFIPVLVLTFFLCLLFLFKIYKCRKIRLMVRALSIIVFSCVMHTLTFMNHSLTHDWSMIKYNFVFVFILFVVFCWIYYKYQDKVENMIKNISAPRVILLIGILIFFFNWIDGKSQDFYKKRVLPHNYPVAEFIKSNTDFYDVIYSPDYEPVAPHIYLEYAISKKKIYKVSALDDIPASALPDSARINILIADTTLNDDRWRILKNEDHFPQQVNNYYLFKFSKKDYQSLFYRYQKNNNL